MQFPIPHSASAPDLGSSGGSFGHSARGLNTTLARARDVAAGEAQDAFTKTIDSASLRPLTAATTIKRERGRQDAQPGMVWSQDYRANMGFNGPGWRTLTPAEVASRRMGTLSRAGL